MVGRFSQCLALPFPLSTHQCNETHAKHLRWYLTHVQLHNGFAFMIFFLTLSSGLEVSKMLCSLISPFTKDGTSWNCSGRHYLFIHSMVLSGCFSLLLFSPLKTSSPSSEHSIGARLVFCSVHRISRFFSLSGAACVLLCCSPGVSPLGFLIWNWHFLG